MAVSVDFNFVFCSHVQTSAAKLIKPYSSLWGSKCHHLIILSTALTVIVQKLTEWGLHIWINMFCFSGITLVCWLLLRFKLSHRAFPLRALETLLLDFNTEADFSALLDALENRSSYFEILCHQAFISWKKHVGFWIICESLLYRALKSIVVVRSLSQWLLFSMSLWK